MIKINININLTALVGASTSASVGVWKVDMTSGRSHHILDVVAGLANDV